MNSKKIINVTDAMYSLYRAMDYGAKKSLALLLIFTLVASLAEALFINLTAPMIMLWMGNDLMSTPIQNLLIKIGLENFSNNSGAIVILFICSTVLSGALRLLVIYKTGYLSCNLGASLSKTVFDKVLKQDYLTIVSVNSSVYITLLTEKIAMVTSMIMSMLVILTSSVMFCFIWIGLFFLDAEITFLATLFFSMVYIVVIKISRSRIDHNSYEVSKISPLFIKVIRESLGSIRDVLLMHRADKCVKKFDDYSKILKKATAENVFMSQSPRYIIESVALVIIGILSLNSGIEGDNKLLPILGALALAAQRMLPMIQQIYSGYVNIRLSKHALKEVLKFAKMTNVALNLDHPVSVIKNNDIKFQNVFFKYDESNNFIINNLSLSLKMGSKVALTGPSGSGKSTFLDLLTGLVFPLSGSIRIGHIEIDKSIVQSWRGAFSYVSQTPFLLDGSIAENIALGELSPGIDISRVRDCCHMACLGDYIESLKDGYQTLVGEGGVTLSGGQRQRLAIARGLYLNKPILILDESTSAIDSELECKILTNIFNFNQSLTVIHVTHRLNEKISYDQKIDLLCHINQ